MIDYDRLLNEFLELVQIDSETKNEQKIANVLKQKFSELGLDVDEDDTKEKTGHGSGNLICTLKGTKSVPHFLQPIWTQSCRVRALNQRLKTVM